MSDLAAITRPDAAPSGRALLVVGGVVLESWTSVTVSRSLDSVASTWSFEATSRAPGQTAPLPIRPLDEVEVWLDGTRVIAGFVDDIAQGIAADSASVTVSGRSRTGQIVDCHPEPRHWRNRSLLQIARDLCAPLGVEVVTDVPLPPIARAATEPDESVFDVLERLARTQSVILTDDADGALVLGLVGASEASTPLRIGVNVLSASHTTSARGRYSEYVCRGQRIATADQRGIACASSLGTVTDSVVGVPRRLELRSEQSASPDDCRRRALWEARVRAGRSVTVEATVQGWTQVDGTLWEPGQLVWCWLSEIGIEEQLCIGSAEYSLSDAGTITRLTLQPLEAFQPEPLPGARAVTPRKSGRWASLESFGSAAVDTSSPKERRP